MTTLPLRAPLALLFIALSLHCTGASADSPPEVPVVLSISTNTAQINGFSNIVIHRNLPPDNNEGLFAKVFFTVEHAVGGMARDTSVFITSLPPGDYNFSEFKSAQGKTLKVGEKNLLGRFTVTAGKPVDLGRLLLTPVNDKVIIGRAARSASNAEILRTFFPDKAALFAGELAPGWNEQLTAEAQSLERHALARTVGADCATERADGTVFAASRLGTILIRSPQGLWRGVHGPTLESLLCVLPVDLPDTEVIAVGELGTLVRKPRGQDVLVPINPGNLPPGILRGIQGSPAAGWFVKHQVGDNLTLFRSPTLEAGTWTPVLKTDAKFNERYRRNSMFLWQTPYGMGYAGAQGPIKSFDQATGQWSDIALPAGYDRVMNVFAGTNGDLSLQAGTGNPIWLVVETAFVSRDRGVSWKAIPSPTKPVAPWMQILHDGTLMMVNHGTFTLQTSNDDGVTWTMAGKLPNGGTALPLRSGALLNIGTGQYGWFTIDASLDNGKTWMSDYSTFNHQAYEAEHKDK
jgi:hypothetical protein